MKPTRKTLDERTRKQARGRLRRAACTMVIAGLGSAGLALPAWADAAISFAGKTIVMTIGNAAGGQTDLSGRLFGRFLVKYLPGHPDLVVENQPGAEGITALNLWVIRAKRDGTAITIGAGTQTNPLYYRAAHARYDLKTFKFAGGIGAPGGGLFISKAAEKRLHDKSLPPVVMGALSAIRSNMYMTLWGSLFLGWNTKWVVGYPDTQGLSEAVLRGEIDMSSFGSLPEIKALQAAGKFTVVAQEGRIDNGKLVARPAIGDAPIFANLIAGKIRDREARDAYAYWESISRIGQWVALPPGTPDDIVAVYRKSIEKIFDDPEYREQAVAFVSDGVPMDPQDLEALVDKLDRTPDAVFAYLKKLQIKAGFTRTR